MPRHDDWSEDEDVFEQMWFVQAVQRWLLLIIAGALLGAVAGFVYATLRPLNYEGITTLLVVPPSQPTGTQINPATFRAIVENATLASQVIDEVKLANTSPQKFVQTALAVEEIRGTNIVRVKVTLPDPKLAADASRLLTQKAVSLTQQIPQQEGAAVQEQLKNHLRDAEERLRIAEKELLTYKQNAQIDVIKGDTDAQLKERGELLSLVVNIEAERARLAAAQAEIKRQSPLLSAARSPSAEEALRRSLSASEGGVDAQHTTAQSPTAEEALRRSPSVSGDNVDTQHLDLTNPYVNPVYQTLDFQIATSRTRIAALEKQRDELINVKKLGGKDLAQLNELYRREIELGRLKANFDLTTRVYTDLAVKYQQSRTQSLGNVAQLQVVDAALPPDQPVARKRIQYGMFGAVAGLVCSALLAVAWESRKRTLPSST